MNIDEKVALLEYQIKLLKHMVLADQHPFFMFALDYYFNEQQVKALMKVLSILNIRLKGEYTSLEEFVTSTNDDLTPFSIDMEILMKHTPPSLDEFNDLSNLILGKDFKLKYLLIHLQKQNIFPILCEFLLSKLNTTAQ